jgi:hypothetical protein
MRGMHIGCSLLAEPNVCDDRQQSLPVAFPSTHSSSFGRAARVRLALCTGIRLIGAGAFFRP